MNNSCHEFGLKTLYREELEKQRAAANYQRLHAKGKTEEARADLARLAIIKAQREEAAKKRADEAKSKYTLFCFIHVFWSKEDIFL